MRTGWPPRLAVSAGQLVPRRLPRAAAGTPARAAPPPDALEAAFLLIAEPPAVWALDSASLVVPEHVGIDRRHRLAWRTARRQAGDRAQIRRARRHSINDAGIGNDEAGMSRLPALDARGIAAATVVGGKRPHRRRALDLRGRYHQPGQRPRRRARPARGHQRPRVRRRLSRRAAAERERHA